MFACLVRDARGQRGKKGSAKASEDGVHIVRSAKQLYEALTSAHLRGELVAVQWAAAWCSLSNEADACFERVAAIGCERRTMFLRADIDEVQGVEPGLSVLPSFSVYEQGCLKGHFIGLESCKELAWKLQQDTTAWDGVDTAAGDSNYPSPPSSNASEDEAVAPTPRQAIQSHSRGSSFGRCTSLESCRTAFQDERMSMERGGSLTSYSDVSSSYAPRYIRKSLGQYWT